MSDPAQHSVVTVGRGTIWSLLNNSISQFLVLGVFLVTARFVSKEDFGVMAICFVVIELFRQVSVESIGIALTAKKDASDKDYNASFLLNLCIGFVSAGLLFLCAPLIADFLNNNDITNAMQMVSILLLTAGLSRTHETWLSRHMKFKSLALRSLISIIAGGVIGIVMAVQGWGLTALIAQQLITSVVGVIFLWGTTAWRPSFRTDKKSITDLLFSAKHIMLTGLANFANGQSDTFFAAYYLGPVATGVYNAAKRITFALNALVSTALGKVSLPVFAVIQKNPETLKISFLKAVAYTTLLTAPFYAGIIALSPDFVLILLGESWADVAPVLAVLTVAAYLTTIGQYNQNIFLVSGKSHWQTLLSSTYGISNIILFILVARYGLLALACAFTLRAIVLYPLSAGGALYLLKIPVWQYLRQIMPSILAASCMGGAVFFAGENMDFGTIARLAILVPFGVVVYVALIILFDRKTTIEALQIARTVIFSKST